ncbi:MAG: hypothetical protein DMD78_28790 [Candidatus Rokuibacteriota bacterium]|nr:MAG: hypothetical protein DMD78_28790 [Candidatus Rokubacteria bacterium]
MSSDDDRDVEAAAAAVIGPKLAGHLQLCERSFLVMSKALMALPERTIKDTPQACRVCAGLLIKISNDLRTVALLALRGYPVQAATLTSSLYESAVTIGYIADDNALAEAWIAHGGQDPLKPFRGVWEMTKQAVTRLSLPDSEVQTETLYRHYTQLCWAKHGNSAFLLDQTFQRIAGGVEGSNGPSTSDAALRASSFALEQAVRLVFLACAVFVQHHVPRSAQPPLVAEVNTIGAERQRFFNTDSIDRWAFEPVFSVRHALR